MPQKQNRTAPAKAENPNAFKHAISKTLLQKMAKAIHSELPSFDQKEFLSIAAKLETLELKARVCLIRDQLYKQLPSDYPKALRTLIASLKHNTLRGFDLWPYTEFVQTYGLDHRDLSLEALREITPRFTSEFAVRPFITKYPKETLSYLLKNATHKDVHVRRWASEGSRPRLPWGERLKELVKNPRPTLKILELLKFDEELYVRKSVSNHLNDISKDHPELAISTLKRWQAKAGKTHAKKIDWIIHRALRTLIKDGNAKALELIGASQDIKVKVKDLRLEKQLIKMNERLTFDFVIHSNAKKSQKLVVDYIIHYKKSNKDTAPKVFKLKNFELPAQGKVTIKKNHPVKEITTRRHYAGEHFIEIQVNGKTFAKKSWHLKV